MYLFFVYLGYSNNISYHDKRGVPVCTRVRNICFWLKSDIPNCCGTMSESGNNKHHKTTLLGRFEDNWCKTCSFYDDKVASAEPPRFSNHRESSDGAIASDSSVCRFAVTPVSNFSLLRWWRSNRDCLDGCIQELHASDVQCKLDRKHVLILSMRSLYLSKVRHNPTTIEWSVVAPYKLYVQVRS